MKKLIALLLVCALLAGCTPQSPLDVENQFIFREEEMPDFSGLNDPTLLAYLENAVYSELVAQLDNNGYFVENISALYISKEYLDELSYNSKENIFFGFTLSELDECFAGTRYVFSLGDNGETTVQPFEPYDNTKDIYAKALSNVAMSTGIILMCVTVSVVTGGIGATAVSAIFAASAQSGAVVGLAAGAIGGIAAGVVKGIETQDFNEALKAAALVGSEAMKFGVITGTVAGGVAKAEALKGATINGLSMDEAAKVQRESKFPIDVIKQFESIKQYEICKSAGLTAKKVNGKTALVRTIDINFTGSDGRTNLERMQNGEAPLDSSGTAYQLHHIGQKTDSTLAILTAAEHKQGGNYNIWHDGDTDNPSSQPGWSTTRSNFWKAIAEGYTKG